MGKNFVMFSVIGECPSTSKSHLKYNIANNTAVKMDV